MGNVSLRGVWLFAVAAVIAVAGVLMLWVGPVQGEAPASNDTVFYARQAYQDAGDNSVTATTKAIKLVCDSRVEYKTAPSRAKCQDDLVGTLGFPAKYQEIFRARPLYPAVTSLFVRLMGSAGFYAAVLVLQVAAGVLIAAATREIGVRKAWPLAAVAAYFLLPSGYVGTRFLSEAAVAPGVAALLYGLALIVRSGRHRIGAVVVTASFAWLFAAREATALPAAAFLLIVTVVALTARQPWAKTLLATCAAAFAAMSAAAVLLSWPSATDGVTDIETEHFTQPTPHNLYSKFLHSEMHFWRSFAEQISSGAYLVVLAALGLFAVVTFLRGWTAAALLAVAAVGPASLLIHPGDWQRMLFPMWIVVAVGLPLLGVALRERTPDRPDIRLLEPAVPQL